MWRSDHRSAKIPPVPALDAIDAELVRELQQDGRASVQALADRVGLSRTATRARVAHLLDSGVVRVVGIVHAGVAGITAIGHASVAFEGESAPLVGAITEREAATFVSRIAGQYGIVVELRTRDDTALAAELDWLRAQPGVRRVDVVRVSTVVKDAYSVVRGRDPVPLDELDWTLMQELQRDGRAPYARLAAVVGLSQAATRARVVRLVDSGSLHISGLIDSSALGVREAAGIGLRAAGDALAVAADVAALPGLNFVIAGFGRFDVICGADAPSRAELLQVIEKVRTVANVREAESWYHLEVVKESYAVDQEQAAARLGGIASRR
jgi:DNA-binding Lrp family transcriptional regulator